MSRNQITNQILMIRPAHFGANPETAASNAFQESAETADKESIAHLAIQEFDGIVAQLISRGLDVYLVKDTPSPQKPDAIFPNNWISFHQCGTLVVYPMMSASRRQEVRNDVIEEIGNHFKIPDVWRLDRESHGEFLEGTGSLVLDRENRIAYACRSPRTSPKLLKRFCERLKFAPHLFDATDPNGQPIYHTNVMMALTQKYALVCTEAIPYPKQKEQLRQRLEKSGKVLLEISFDQVQRFAGNVLQLERPGEKPVLMVSAKAISSFNDEARSLLGEESEILCAEIPTIEKFGGGSIRCMLAEIFPPQEN